jgi:hypothetical protein
LIASERSTRSSDAATVTNLHYARKADVEDHVIAATFGPGQVVYSILWFFLFFVEIWLMITVFIDIFRSNDLKGWQKALWVIPVLVFPLLGVLLYLVVRGTKMRAHQIQTLEENEQVFRHYLQREVGPRWSPADELNRLADLRDRGELTADEYRRLKARLLDEETRVA